MITTTNQVTKTLIVERHNGSILGPQLFLLYVNDLCNASNILKPIMFADDTNLFFSAKNINHLFQTMNKEFIVIQDLNATKKKIQFFLFFIFC